MKKTIHPSKKPKCFFIDIDGVIIEQDRGSAYPYSLGEPTCLTPGTIEKITAWSLAGHTIIITTARKECWRKETEVELKRHRILYDKLIMGLPTGQRILINDAKPEDRTYPMAIAYTLSRNEGLIRVDEGDLANYET